MSFQDSFKALSDPTRRQIIELLRNGKLTAGEIVDKFHMTGASISHHLSILKNAGLVTDDKQGKYIYYELNLSVVEEILSWLVSLKEERNE
ncbi:winged helix-turn-helix transcriptional regulator [Sedimentibacter hydroxybenzoicus DSM 7310]|uniref:Winged helix-turn-helix transcriptional regulator n=1 Tax=Sedimentibacter hydroxybenzoicus DSM 7310 TaxID=1123245 RepID=A0A974BHS3_SEDHY|nr:autorepressor SdpR family transcription factor [Sedimentibacter hydroxybenzoicus]NYB72920.1 winged helix-turn-helix transcriptional regulator [Sedimentibacter hydroxybenzoicus DSM 7310]